MEPDLPSAAGEAAPATALARAADERLERGLSWAFLALAVGVGAWLFTRSWRAWADVLVDYGRELYVPWRLAAGDVLYRDVAYFNGPLSPYVDALLFRLTGPSYAALCALDGALFALFSVLLWRHLRALANAPTASLFTLFAIPCFGLAHVVGIGNYNWLSPYSHEMTHGLLLALGALVALERGLCGDGPRRRRSRGWLLGAGALLGLVFLTKAELFVAAAAGVGARLACDTRARGLLPTVRSAALVLLPALLVFVLAVALLAPALGWGDAVVSALGSWPGLWASRTTELAFYQVGMGFDDPARRATIVAVSAAIVAAFALAALTLERFAPTAWRAGPARLVVIVAVFAIALGAWLVLDLRALRIARPLPVFALGLALWTSLRTRRSAGARAEAACPGTHQLWSARAAFAWFALALTAKMVLYTRFEHYGFALALPATALFALGTSAWLPRAFAAGQAPTWAGLALTAALLTGAATEWVGKSLFYYGKKTNEVGTGGDRLLTDARGPFVARTLAELQERFPIGAEILVLPEGVMLNYLARKKTPTSFVNFMPPELLLYGEEAILAALDAHPPDGIVLVHKDTSEYGFPLFGTHYGQRIAAWVRDRYQPVWLDPHGQVPLEPGTAFGVAILVPRAR